MRWFVRGDIEELERQISKVFDSLKTAAQEKRSETAGRAVAHDLANAEALAHDLVAKLTAIEERLLAQARLTKRAVG